jgi:ferric-dicitrate binding protein FerR (iron transport regulator)
MGKINSIIEISELIARDMSGQLNQWEKNLLQEWVNNSEENQKLYRKIVDADNLSQRNKLYEEIDTDRAWVEVEKLITVPKRKLTPLFLKYAAAILVPIFLGVTSYQYLIKKPVKNKVTNVGIKQGSNEAVLVMSNGEKVKLLKDSKETLLENDGTVINNTHNELSYAGQKSSNVKETLLNTLIVPRGGEFNLVLSDGSRVFVNSMSKLEFPVSFTGNKREITLEGEAYFEVAKDKSRPFIVKIKGVQVEVLGTSFNIKAYPEDHQSFTTLVEGKVKLSSGNQSSNDYFLEPNQQAVYDPSNQGMVISKVDAGKFVEWTKGRYYFSDQSLEEIMKTLSRWYDFNYKFENQTIKNIRFEGGLNKYGSIYPILDIINETGKVKVTVKDKDVMFSKI